jgi:rRNA maturation endonuclease Nob1
MTKWTACACGRLFPEGDGGECPDCGALIRNGEVVKSASERGT